MPPRRLLTGLLLLLLGCASANVAQEAEARDAGLIVTSGGLFDVADRRDVLELGIEWRGRPLAWQLRLNLGLMIHSDSGGYAFVGARRDFRVSELWGLSLGLAIGAYEEGDGLDLGGTAQFRSSIEIYRELTARSRLGVGFYHLSHGGIYSGPNPGSNSAVLVYGFRLN